MMTQPLTDNVLDTMSQLPTYLPRPFTIHIQQALRYALQVVHVTVDQDRQRVPCKRTKVSA